MKKRYENLLMIESRIYDIYQELIKIESINGKLNEEYIEKCKTLKILQDFEKDELDKMRNYVECLFFLKKVSQNSDYIYDLTGIDLAFDILNSEISDKNFDLTYIKEKIVYTRTINKLMEKAISFYDFKWLEFSKIDCDEYDYRNSKYIESKLTYIDGDIGTIARACDSIIFGEKEHISIFSRKGTVEQIFCLLETNYEYDLINSIDDLDYLYRTETIVRFKHNLIYLNGKLEERYFFYQSDNDSLLKNENNKSLYRKYGLQYAARMLVTYFIKLLKGMKTDSFDNVSYSELPLIEACDCIISTSLNYLDKSTLINIIESFDIGKNNVEGINDKQKIYNKMINNLRDFCK